MDDDEITLSDREFDRIRERIYKDAGISLGDAKRVLVSSRLNRIVSARGLGSFDEYVDFLDSGASREDRQVFVNALTTNLTRFYREDHHFDHLIGYVGQLMKRPDPMMANGKPRLRIWSAGCSTGQEPYTIAMALMGKYPQLKSWDFRILGTDVDTQVVETAARGVYSLSDLEGLSDEQAAVFEKPTPDTIRVPENLRKLMTFKPLNLMEKWPVKGPFDAIFCRNVTIYFDKATQTRIFERFSALLNEGSYLYIGHSENMKADELGYQLEGKTIYRRLSSQSAQVQQRKSA